jgi:hypothetical protein
MVSFARASSSHTSLSRALAHPRARQISIARVRGRSVPGLKICPRFFCRCPWRRPFRLSANANHTSIPATSVHAPASPLCSFKPQPLVLSLFCTPADRCRPVVGLPEKRTTPDRTKPANARVLFHPLHSHQPIPPPNVSSSSTRFTSHTARATARRPVSSTTSLDDTPAWNQTQSVVLCRPVSSRLLPHKRIARHNTPSRTRTRTPPLTPIRRCSHRIMPHTYTHRSACRRLDNDDRNDDRRQSRLSGPAPGGPRTTNTTHDVAHPLNPALHTHIVPTRCHSTRNTTTIAPTNRHTRRAQAGTTDTQFSPVVGLTGALLTAHYKEPTRLYTLKLPTPNHPNNINYEPLLTRPNQST